jgi:hypothetical protein
MGVPDRRGGALLAPSLSLHVATKLWDEAAIAKERRKASEARSDNRTLQPPFKPKGKSGPKGPPEG